MDAEYIINFSKHTIAYLENDKRSFEYVIASDQLQGKLGFALIATAMAAFDTYAWILYQTFDLRKKNSELFSSLLKDTRFFDRTKYMSDKLFYSRIRCGVMHQLYPKEAGIVANLTFPILCQNKGLLCVNAYALYCDVLDGIKKIHQHFLSLPNDEKLNLSLKLILRAKIDAEAAGNDILDLSMLPTA